MSDLKLYRVRVEYEVLVMAVDEIEAEQEAEGADKEVGPFCTARLVTPTELLWMPKYEKESVPENSEDDRTVEEILSDVVTPKEP